MPERFRHIFLDSSEEQIEFTSPPTRGAQFR